MLVLSRKAGDTVRIDDEIIVKIMEIEGTRVRIGIEAPRCKRIVRGELAPLAPSRAAELARIGCETACA